VRRQPTARGVNCAVSCAVGIAAGAGRGEAVPAGDHPGNGHRDLLEVLAAAGWPLRAGGHCRRGRAEYGQVQGPAWSLYPVAPPQARLDHPAVQARPTVRRAGLPIDKQDVAVHSAAESIRERSRFHAYRTGPSARGLAPGPARLPARGIGVRRARSPAGLATLPPSAVGTRQAVTQVNRALLRISGTPFPRSRSPVSGRAYPHPGGVSACPARARLSGQQSPGRDRCEYLATGAIAASFGADSRSVMPVKTWAEEERLCCRWASAR
jgi:hypothetical protein